MGDETKLDELLQVAMARAEQIGALLEDPDESWPPRVVAAKWSEMDRLIELQLEFESEEAKFEVLEELSRWIVEEEICVFSITLSAFAVVMEDDAHPEAPGVRPGTHPDRKAILLVVAMDADEVKTTLAEIDRSEDGPPTLGEWEADISDFSGALAEPFRDALKIARRRYKDEG
jgi:hypothetical protein